MAFAADKHRNQRRKDVEATPYINHPIGLANLLANEAGVTDVSTLCAAILHDTIEDTETTEAELQAVFGEEIARLVVEVTDDKNLPKKERKRMQIENGSSRSEKAKRIKVADKICNLRDLANNPPHGWEIALKQGYIDWAKAVIDRQHGGHAKLESLFREAYEKRSELD